MRAYLRACVLVILGGWCMHGAHAGVIESPQAIESNVEGGSMIGVTVYHTTLKPSGLAWLDWARVHLGMRAYPAEWFFVWPLQQPVSSAWWKTFAPSAGEHFDSSTSQSVPEPGTWALLLLGIAGLLLARRRSKKDAHGE